MSHTEESMRHFGMGLYGGGIEVLVLYGLEGLYRQVKGRFPRRKKLDPAAVDRMVADAFSEDDGPAPDLPAARRSSRKASAGSRRRSSSAAAAAAGATRHDT
eukprot:EG_transcript_10141